MSVCLGTPLRAPSIPPCVSLSSCRPRRPRGDAQSATYIEQAGLSLARARPGRARWSASSRGQNLDRALLGSLALSNVATISVEGSFNTAQVRPDSSRERDARSSPYGSSNAFRRCSRTLPRTCSSATSATATASPAPHQTGDGNTYRLRSTGSTRTGHSVAPDESGNTASPRGRLRLESPVSIEQYGGATVSIVRR